MSELSSFSNAPTVTEFAKGMRISSLASGTLGGMVIGVGKKNIEVWMGPGLTRYAKSLMPEFVLDLSEKCLWVGRVYLPKDGVGGRVRIAAPPEFTEQGVVHTCEEGLLRWWTISSFLDAYEPELKEIPKR